MFLVPPPWDQFGEYKIESLDMYFLESDEDAVQIPLESTLTDVLNNKR